MIKVALTIDGQPISIVQPGHDGMYSDGGTYGNFVARIVPYELSSEEILQTIYWVGDVQLTRLKRPTIFHVWDGETSKWVADIGKAKDGRYAEFKDQLHSFIVSTCNFPEWKQINYSDEWVNLSIKKLSGGISSDEQTRLETLTAVRVWKNNLLSEKDGVKLNVYKAKSLGVIQAAIDSFKWEKAPFDL